MGKMSEIEHILRTSEDATKELSDYLKFIHPDWNISKVYTTTLYFKRQYEKEGRNNNDRKHIVSS